MAWLWQKQLLPRYTLIKQDHGFPNVKENRPGAFMVTRRLARQSGVFFLLGAVLALVPIAILCTNVTSFWGTSSDRQVRLPKAAADDRGALDRRLVVVMAANHGHVNLCKATMSAMALGYPSPVIVNWGQVYDGSDPRWLGSSHLAKISGPLDYLDAATLESTHAADRLRDDDLVLLVDAFDTWFQLPPDILIHRYHESIKAGDAHLLAQWNSTEPMPMKQTIVVSPQKRCWPSLTSGSDLRCDQMPESTAREDLYGPETDKDPENDVWRVRAKYLNSGAVMGPVGDVRRYLRRASQKMEMHFANGRHLTSDQALFGETWADQEVWRSWMREQSTLGGSKKTMDEISESTYEYHVGLNYEEDLFVATVFHEGDGDIVELGSEDAVSEESEKRGIEPVRFQGVPTDVAQASLPLHALGTATTESEGTKTSTSPTTMTTRTTEDIGWSDMALYVDFYSATVPVVIHHNAHVDNLKARRETWWDRIWYFLYLRELIETHLQPGSLRPLATVPVLQQSEEADESEEIITFTAPKSDEYRRRPRIYQFEERGGGWREGSMEAICSDPDAAKEKRRRWFDEVFRDGKGPVG